jgi:D-alanine-D-alanine ligase
VLNLCDGDEINGTPGISVIRKLIANNLVFTGADEHFYQITTSKIPMKQAFDEFGVSHAPWQIIRDTSIDENVFNRIGSPMIVKPAVSGGSMGVGIKNVVRDKASLIKLIEDLNEGYRGWNLMADGLIAEKYISGREFTALICGNHDDPDSIHVYNPVERVFHESLPDEEKFLSFDRLWEIYEAESAMPESAHFFEYHPVDISLSERIKVLSKASFIATGGVGYARVDVRMDQHNEALYLLEINAQCGISEDENYTSIGAILKFEKQPFYTLVSEIIQLAIEKHNSIIEKDVVQSNVNLS